MSDSPSTTILAFDTSTARSVLVLGRWDANVAKGTVLGIRERSEAANQTSTLLVGEIEALVRDAGISLSDVEVIACGRGPGTFTGTRVAVATAKGLALGLGCPVVPVSTLAAMVATTETPDPVLALLPVTRGDVYAGLRDAHGEMTEWSAPLASLIERPDLARLSQTGVIVGAPAVLEHPDFPTAWVARSRPAPGPSAQGLWLAAGAVLSTSGSVDPASLHAVYHRKSYAEMGANRPKRPVSPRSPLKRGH